VAKLENSAIGNLRSTTQNIVLNFLNKNRIIDSTKLAIDIQKSLIYNLKKHYSHIKDGGVRPAPFWVLVGTNMPAILIEMGYLSNKIEAKKLNSKTYQKRLAKYIADGIENYFRKNP
jgi:N-acetylmuramoyl-L-alanine amidase